MEMPPETQLRAYRDNDLDALYRLISETIEISYSPVYPARAVAFFKEFHSREKIRERSQSGQVLLIEQSGQLVATGSRVGNEIFAVFVHPDCQQGGFGKQLMADLEASARAEGQDQITLSISLPSRRFYEACGYEVTEELSRDLGDGQKLDFWKARKLL
ncbi:MAG: GNAT family N-acetyltransferase [Proteobacteria bacterium]|nr:GNAT family N-acetyltransferase [Pseudomonadota bacterium]